MGDEARRQRALLTMSPAPGTRTVARLALLVLVLALSVTALRLAGMSAARSLSRTACDAVGLSARCGTAPHAMPGGRP